MVLSVVLAPKEVIWCDEKSLQVDSFFWFNPRGSTARHEQWSELNTFSLLLVFYFDFTFRTSFFPEPWLFLMNGCIWWGWWNRPFLYSCECQLVSIRFLHTFHLLIPAHFLLCLIYLCAIPRLRSSVTSLSSLFHFFRQCPTHSSMPFFELLQQFIFPCASTWRISSVCPPQLDTTSWNSVSPMPCKCSKGCLDDGFPSSDSCSLDSCHLGCFSSVCLGWSVDGTNCSLMLK